MTTAYLKLTEQKEQNIQASFEEPTWWDKYIATYAVVVAVAILICVCVLFNPMLKLRL